MPKVVDQLYWDAAPAKAQRTPKRPRRVLICNTPAHLMDKDPHKGYCIPYGTAALETIGRKTGAFELVTSDEYGLPYDRANLRVLLSLDPGRSNIRLSAILRFHHAGQTSPQNVARTP